MWCLIGREYTAKTGHVLCLNCGEEVEAERQKYSEMYQIDCSNCSKTYYLDEYQMYVEHEEFEDSLDEYEKGDIDG